LSIKNRDTFRFFISRKGANQSIFLEETVEDENRC